MCKWQMSALLTLKNTIGLFPRFGCDAGGGTKTVLAVLAILASVLAWGSAPVRADDNDGDLGRDKVRVLTQNMYIGADLTPIALAKTFPQFRDAITTVTQNIVATKPAERAAAMAAEIAKQRPDFVALHEAWRLTAGGIIVEDLLQSLLDNLKALGQPYDLVRAGTVNGIVNDNDVDLTTCRPPFNIHLTDRGAILMRTDVDIAIIGVQSQPFLTPISIPTPLPPPCDTLTSHPGYVSVDAIVRGRPLRFVSVHLIPGPITRMLAHTTELLQLAADTTTLPLVFGGDFNTTADDPSNPSHQIYQALIDAGLTDAWNPHIHRPGLGLTCCQDPSLTKPSSLFTRVDLILFTGAFAVEDINLIGNREMDRTPSGLWPSDHAGLVATLATPLCQHEPRCQEKLKETLDD